MLNLGLWPRRVGGGTPSNVLLSADFASDADGFSAGTRVAAEGWEWATGYLSVAAAEIATRSFAAQTEGVVRIDVRVRIADTSVATGANSVQVSVLPTAGAAESANSLATVFLIRATGTGNDGTTTTVRVRYRDGTGFVHSDIDLPRQVWLDLAFVVDLDAGRWDLYISDQLFLRNLTFPNGSAADLSRVLLNVPGGNAGLFDAVRVTRDWAIPEESVLLSDDFTVGSGAIEASAPAVDLVSDEPQPWLVPIASGKSGFTRGATGLVPGANTRASAFVHCGAEGVFEATFTASSNTNRAYGGIIFRSWGGDSDQEDDIIFRFWNGSSFDVALFGGDRTGATQTYASAAVPAGTTVSAGADYTLKVEIRGRFGWFYINDALQFGGPVTLQNRGLIQETLAGPFIQTTTGVGDAENRVKSFSYTGALPPREVRRTIGPLTVATRPGTVQQMYHSGLALPDRNLFWSRGVQYMHGATADAVVDGEHRVLLDAPNVFAREDRCLGLREDEALHHCHAWITVRRNVIWIREDFRILNTTDLNYAPDLDLRPDLWSLTLRWIDATGGSTETTKTLGTWTALGSSGPAPRGFQVITDAASGDQVRLTTIAGGGDLALGTPNWGMNVKHVGSGDPISVAPGLGVSAPDFGHVFPAWRMIVIEAGGLALSDAVITAIRDDFKTPATLSFTTGSLKTDAAGDDNGDGWNGRYGWHEITASSGAAVFTLPGATTRHYPAFRIHGLGASPSVAGLTAGTDYVIDSLGDGSHLLQILGVVSADTEYDVGSS